MREEECLQSFGGTSRKRERPLRRSRHRWEDNSKVGLGEKWWDVMYFILLVVINLRAL
jgi:hypothetical protein